MSGLDLFSKMRAGRHLNRLRNANTLLPEEVEAAGNALVDLGPAAIDLLLESLGHGVAREPALRALSRLLNGETLDRFTAALGSPNPAVATGVVKLLSTADSFDADRLLDRLVASSASRAMLERVLMNRAETFSAKEIVRRIDGADRPAAAILLRLLERRVDPSIVGDLDALVRSPEWSVRLAAIRILGGLDDERVVPRLIPLLGDDNAEIRLQAIQSLLRLKAVAAVPDLVPRLRDDDLKVQSAAIDVLSALGDASTVPLLLDVLRDESEYSRRAAVEVLNVIATTDAIQDLIRALHDDDWWVRVRAADALGSLGGERVVQAVVGLLREDDDFLRRYAVEILNTVPSAAAVPALIGALDDSDWWVRERSIDALGTAKDPRAVRPLIRLLAEDPSVAHLCARALGEIGDASAIAALEAVKESGDPAAQREAQAAILRLRREGSAPGRNAAPGGPDRSPFPKSAPAAPSIEPPAAAMPPASPPPASPAPTMTGWSESTAQAGRPSASMLRPTNFQKLQSGSVLLERYRILRKIGRGGFGAVYLVEDLTVKDSIILKILNPQLSADELAVQRFAQELKLTRRISHPNVIRLYDFLELGGLHAVSMEYFPSRNLEQVLRDEGTPPLDQVLRFAVQMCRGLAAAHELGVVHRDMKPANVLVNETGEVKIVDFGLAWADHQRETRLTRSGLLVGTPEYMAPEQIRGESVDARADLYALGIILYELISGRPPYTGDSPVNILFQHVGGEAKPVGELVESLPAEVGTLVGELMAVERESRPFSALDLADDIDAMGERLFGDAWKNNAANRRIS